jgi:hypothetical protein
LLAAVVVAGLLLVVVALADTALQSSGSLPVAVAAQNPEPL